MLPRQLSNIQQGGLSVPPFETLDLFPTQFIHGSIDLPIDQMCNYVRDVVGEIKKQDDRPRNNYTSYFAEEVKTQMMREPWYNHFSNSIKDMYVHYLAMYYNTDIEYLTRHDIQVFPWVNRYDITDFHNVHNHTGAQMAGTLYLKTSETAPIIFVNPNIEATSYHGVQSEEEHPYNDYSIKVGSPGHHSMHKFMPRPGEFLMWPGYMMHYVEQCGDPEQYDYERISISFNVQHNRPPLNDTNGGDQMAYKGVFR